MIFIIYICKLERMFDVDSIAVYAMEDTEL